MAVPEPETETETTVTPDVPPAAELAVAPLVEAASVPVPEPGTSRAAGTRQARG